MPFFKIDKIKGGFAGTVEGEDTDDALDVFARQSGFWDFHELAESMNLSPELARQGLRVRETAAPGSSAALPQPIPDYVIP